tara:strand:- start:7227 stop:7421 length:195 start_codon:yes stop_codon:yes gene_type:complete
MKVKFEQDSSVKDINFSGTVLELLQQLNVNPETVLVVKNEEVITEDVLLKDDDVVELLSVVSGG